MGKVKIVTTPNAGDDVKKKLGRACIANENVRWYSHSDNCQFLKKLNIQLL